jgi:RNA polymerase sigma factor (TIGR02999 family)
VNEELRPGVDRILEDIRSLDGADPAARERLFRAVYADLRAIAGRLMRGRRPGRSWQPTDLVHETFLRLVGQTGVEWEGRAHFFGIAARAMRQVLVDHAREKAARKRGGGQTRVSLTERLGVAGPSDVGVLEIHHALEKLAGLDPRAARVAELKLFGGLAADEIALVVKVSKRTVDGDWSMARMWLSRELSTSGG